MGLSGVTAVDWTLFAEPLTSGLVAAFDGACS